MILSKALNLVHFLLRRRFEVFSSWRRLMCQTGNLQGRRTLREKQTSRLFLLWQMRAQGQLDNGSFLLFLAKKGGHE